jgi:hypothetical protein
MLKYVKIEQMCANRKEAAWYRWAIKEKKSGLFLRPGDCFGK